MSEAGYVTSQNGSKPFLRWAGGKRWLVPHLRLHAPEKYSRYIEPFVGSGAVLLSVPVSKTRIASDVNVELINTFEIVRDRPHELLETLKSFGSEFVDYLSARSRFNLLKSEVANANVERAAHFVYLNKTSFNGLYRENASGEFNVPWGKLKQPLRNIEQQILEASIQLNGTSGERSTKVEFIAGDYIELVAKAEYDDWVYLDPPYSPLSKTANFVAYTSGGFGIQDQVQLRDSMISATQRGVKILMSNSDTPVIRDLYSSEMFKIQRVDVTRSVGAQGRTRVKAAEVLVSNYE